MKARFGETPEAIAASATRQLKGLSRQAKLMVKKKQSKSFGGAMRSLKGKFVEELCEELVRLSWAKLGCAPGRLSFSKAKVSASVSSGYIKRISEFADPKVVDQLKKAGYRCKLDKHVMIDDELVLAVECKSYTEISMLKRIAVDFDIVLSEHRDMGCVLFQLESQLGGNYCDQVTKSEQYSASAAAVLSRFSHVDLNIITMLEGERTVKRPIHEYPKPVTEQAIHQCIATMQSKLRKRKS